MISIILPTQQCNGILIYKHVKVTPRRFCKSICHCWVRRIIESLYSIMIIRAWTSRKGVKTLCELRNTLRKALLFITENHYINHFCNRQNNRVLILYNDSTSCNLITVFSEDFLVEYTILLPENIIRHEFTKLNESVFLHFS